MAALDYTYASDLPHQLIKRGNVKVALQKRRPHAMDSIGLIQQCPYGVDDFRSMGIDDQILAFIMMASYMHIHNSLPRHGLDEFERIVAVINTVDVNIIDVEMQVAVRFRQYGLNKIDFAHISNWRLHVKGGIFKCYSTLQNILGLPNALSNVFYRFFGERYRK
jgi:hypothetical protein